MNANRMRKNIITSLLHQAVSVVCAFILPRLILSAYGSAYNGIVNSVSQFLSCVTLLRGGIGGVTRAALYKSLAENDIEKTSAIVKATELFMRKIAWIFGIALILFAAVYPLLVREEFEWFFSFTLVLILGISTIVQYYFGIANQMLLHADQRLYVYNIWSIAATVMNTMISVLLIQAGYGIRVAKLVSAVMFSITPIMLHVYVRKTYSLPRDIAPDYSAIQQRWDAFAHQVAAFVHTNTDILVLTVFSNLRQVSVYSVYCAVVSGINTVISSVANVVEASLGNALARKDEALLRVKFSFYELIMHIIGGTVFSCAAILIVPFIMVYTAGVNDVNYNQPLLGCLMCLAYWLSAIRLPYQNVIEAAGQFKQTKGVAVMEAILNVCLSYILVARFGTVGVIIGTVAAMVYRTICYAIYARKNILHESIFGFMKRVAVSFLALGLIVMPIYLFQVNELLIQYASNYTRWVIAATVVFLYVLTVTVAVNFLCYFQRMINLARLIFKKQG